MVCLYQLMQIKILNSLVNPKGPVENPPYVEVMLGVACRALNECLLYKLHGLLAEVKEIVPWFYFNDQVRNNQWKELSISFKKKSIGKVELKFCSKSRFPGFKIETKRGLKMQYCSKSQMNSKFKSKNCRKHWIRKN